MSLRGGWRLALAAWIGPLVIGCGTVAHDDSDAGDATSSGDVGSSGDGARKDTGVGAGGDASTPPWVQEGGVLGTGDSSSPYNYVDGSGDCGAFPINQDPWHTDCCESRDCQGHCLLGMDGGVSCDCYGIAGGCPAGTVCCTFGGLCTVLAQCGLGP